MQNKLTLCFYEHPQALHEIDSWQELVKDKITKISEEDSSDFRIVNLNREDGTKENLIVIPMKESNIDFDLTREIVEFGILKEYVYYKTLLFGKFDSSNLDKISKFIKKYEKNGIK